MLLTYRKQLYIVIALLAGMAMLLAACGGSSPSTSSESSSSGDSAGGQLNIAGSSAMLPLFQAATEQYQKANPDVRIALTGGGSGAGRSQVCQGDVQIGNSDVPITEEEMKDLNCSNAEDTTVCIQGFVVVANPAGPGSVTDLSKDDLIAIFSGKMTNWSEVGGDDAPIVVINRARGSGTRQTMANYLFDGDDAQFTEGASEEKENETVFTTVAQTPNTISYLGFAYAGRDGIVVFDIDDIKPAIETIQDSEWPIAGPCNSYTKGAPDGLTKDFLDFMTSSEFQDQPVFETTGFVPIPASDRSN